LSLKFFAFFSFFFPRFGDSIWISSARVLKGAATLLVLLWQMQTDDFFC
jgi:hypothetical protein